MNSTEVRSSPWDFEFRLGQVEEATDEQLTIQELAKISMSPQHAKALLKLLGLHVRLYELKNGAIPDIEFGLAAKEAELMAAAEKRKGKVH